MSNRVAIVVGAGGALGHVTAEALATDGFTVVAVDRNESALKELPDTISHHVGDTTDPDVGRTIIDQIAAEVGSPDVLVNTLGAFDLADMFATTPETLHRMVDVNLGAALWLSQAAAAHMRRSGSGSIVHVSARPGVEPTAGMTAYGVSKAALTHLVRSLDLELRPSGIRVNAVAPQLIDTAKNRSFLTEEQLAHAVSPEAIAKVIGFLVSDAATPVSGAILPTYGG